MDQEKYKILKLIEEKKLNADEAARLLDALDAAGGSAESARSTSGRSTTNGRGGRILHLKVSDLTTGKVKVNLSIPVGIAHVIKSLIPPQEMERMEKSGLKFNAIMEAISGDTIGKLFDIEDEDHHAHVEISIE
jgi:hypothetical protein